LFWSFRVPAITCTDLSFSWPDGDAVITGLTVAFGDQRTALIGHNGAGKSTLLKLIARRLRPTSGTISVRGDVGYLPQDMTLQVGASVADLLEVAPIRAAITAIEAGDVRQELFDTIGSEGGRGGGWDIEERAVAELGRLGLTHLDLDTPVGRLSGGETILTALTALLLRRPAVLLLDEPTNNLDSAARQRLYRAVDEWPGVLVVVSHDRALLDRVDQIAELDEGELRLYGGNFTAYAAQRDAEQQAARRAVAAATADVKREQRDLVESATKQARRDRQGRQLNASGSLPRILANARKRHAQESAGAGRLLHQQRLDDARTKLADAEQQLREEQRIHVDLPGTGVPAGRTVLHVEGLDEARWPPDWTRRQGLTELTIRGPERVALTGPNGAGKTTLLATIAREAGGLDGVPVRAATTAYLPQRLDILDDEATVFENVRSDPHDTRQRLARFGFRGGRADQRAGTLSGGERFRAVLASLLLAEPPPQLLLLDEPTNNLDLASVRQLTEALACYEGALLVVSHDPAFLESIGITRWLRLGHASGLTGE
jgi:ATPase subunit of ABC transporter with duplicated ATPase domains